MATRYLGQKTLSQLAACPAGVTPPISCPGFLLEFLLFCPPSLDGSLHLPLPGWKKKSQNNLDSLFRRPSPRLAVTVSQLLLWAPSDWSSGRCILVTNCNRFYHISVKANAIHARHPSVVADHDNQGGWVHHNFSVTSLGTCRLCASLAGATVLVRPSSTPWWQPS